MTGVTVCSMMREEIALRTWFHQGLSILNKITANANHEIRIGDHTELKCYKVLCFVISLTD